MTLEVASEIPSVRNPLDIIEQIVTPFCVELCAEVDKLYSVNQVFSMARVHMRGRLWDLDR